jgi:hypothetical protein
VPGGSAVYSDLMLYQPLLMTDFRHGFGFPWYSDASGYMKSEGCVDTRHAGIAVLYSAGVASDTDNNIKEGMCIFKGTVYTWGPVNVRKFSSGTWSTVYTGDVNFLLPTSTYLFLFPDGARVQKSTTGASGSFTDTGVDASAIDFKWALIHSGKIYAGEDATHFVHYATESDLSDLEGAGTADAAVVQTGQGDIPSTGAMVYAGELYVTKYDGVWKIGDDGVCKRVLDYSNEATLNNFRSMTIHNGYLVYPVRDKIYQWNGVRQADITPPKVSDTWPYVTYGTFDNMVSVDSFLYCTGVTNEATPKIDLLCYDGVGWHKLGTLATGTDQITMLAYDVANNRLWWHVDSTADHTNYIQFQSNSEFVITNLPTTGTHALYTSRLDAGYRRVIKSAPSLLVGASGCSAGHQYLKIEYSLDGGTFTEWANVTTDGITELSQPDSLHTIEFNYMVLKVSFITDNAALSPVLEDLCLRFLLRPNDFYGFSFTVIGAASDRDDSRSAKDLVEDLKSARTSKSPVQFMDIHGDEHYVYVTSLTETSIEHIPEAMGDGTNWEVMVAINLVELH